MARSSQTSTSTGSLIALNPFDQSSREFVLHKDHILIGSDPTNDLVISEDTVSRHHASITRREARYELADLNSTNGTFVNGQRLTGSTWIDKGDQVRFGEARFVFSTSGAPATSAVGKPTRVAKLWTQLLIVAMIAVVLGGLSGFIGGVAATRNAQTITAKQFVVVDQTGKPRVVMAVLPERGTVPNCRVCDGQAHVIVLDEHGTSTIWPTAGPQPLSAEQLIELLKLAEIFAKAG
jgi:hypothetical protein